MIQRLVPNASGYSHGQMEGKKEEELMPYER
jgi:hypothetical protein